MDADTQAPDIQNPTFSPAAPAISGAESSAPPAPQGTPSVWKTVAMGALWGLAGSAGAKTFGGGLAGGAKGVLVDKPAVEAAQKQMQFESLHAADMHTVALAQARQADLSSQVTQEKIDLFHQNVSDYNKALGIKPSLTLKADNPTDMNTQAVGGLTTLANANGGKIPAIATSNSPASGSKPDHTIDVYAKPGPADLQQNPNGYRKLVDTVSIIQTGHPVSDDDWRSGGGAMQPGGLEQGTEMLQQQRQGQGVMVTKAQNFLYGVPVVAGGAEAVNSNAATSANLHQQLTRYAARSDANPAVVKLLTAQAGAFDSAVKDAQTRAAEANAAAAAQREAAIKGADLQTPQGRAEYAKTLQETINAKYKNAADHQKALLEEGKDPITGETLNLGNAPDEMMVDGNTHQPIPMKMLPSLKPTENESNRADFAKSTLHILDLIDGLRAKGSLPNGPITGLSTAGLIKAGLSSADAQEFNTYVQLAGTASTGAHVAGRFNVAVLDEIKPLLRMNMNDSQFQGAESGLRNVMTPYAQNGGRVTVGQYKREVIGSTKSLNGRNYRVTGIDPRGNAVLAPVQ